MTDVINTREIVLAVLTEVLEEDKYSHIVLREVLEKYQYLEKRDRSFITRVTEGTLENLIEMDYIISQFSSVKGSRMKPVIRNILRIGGYQILFMDKIPHRAAVNEAVEMCRRSGRPRAAGMVNAVLRKFVTNWMNMPEIRCGGPAEYLSIRYSHPLWLVKRLLEILPPEEVEQFLRGNNEIVPTTIHTNLLKTDDETLVEELKQAGIAVERHSWLAHCFTVSGTGNLERLPAFAEGRFMVQDAAAHLVSVVAGPKKGDRVQDVCAAPGGKSFAAAISMEGEGEIISCDIHPHKLKLIDSGARRLGIGCIRTMLADAREHHAAWDRAADMVIADVPCSGLGIIRKKPDIRYKDPKELGQLPEIQRAILDNVCEYVRPGGVLVYSTCTVLPEENEAVTDDFLQAHPEFEMTPFALPLPIGRCEGRLTLWPQRNGTDGFYICRMRRKD